MKKNIIIFILLFFFEYCFGQNGRYLPSGLNLLQETSYWNGDWPPPSLGDNKWKMVFNDEFNGNTVDLNKWRVYNHSTSIPSDAIFYHRPENVTVGGGKLSIVVKKESYEGRDYTAGGIESRSENGFIFERGMFEARIKQTSGWWTHPDFWVWGYNGGEIDVAEYYPYKGRKKIDLKIHNYYKDWPNPYTNNYDYNNSCGPQIKGDDKLDEGFHTYTAIWDKNYVYFYIDHNLMTIESKLEWWPINNDNIPHVPLATNSMAGYYWLRDCFTTTNERGWVILSSGIDKRQGNFNRLYRQEKGLPSTWEVDWVRIYQRIECEEDMVITDGKLFPYSCLSTPYSNEYLNIFSPYTSSLDNPQTSLHSITLGSKSDVPWDNIYGRWETGHYKAESITMLPNFISYPEGHWADPRSMQHWVQPGFLYQAMECQRISSELPQTGYIEPEIIDTFKFSEEDEPFDCSELDSVYIDSLLSSGDTALVNEIVYFLDSVGCTSGQKEYPTQRIRGVSPSFSDFIAGSSSLVLSSRIFIYPNPNNGSFTILLSLASEYNISVTNIVGIEVHRSKIKDQKTTIQLDDSLPPGTYTIRINGPGIKHIEKLTIIK